MLTECTTAGAKISFLSTGQFMEWVLVDPDSSGTGMQLIEDMVTSGGAIGTHSHRKRKVTNHYWIDLPNNPSLEQCALQWADHDQAMHDVLQIIYGTSDHAALRAFNCTRGCGAPDNEPEIHKLLNSFGYTIRE
ncbi:MAG: hypothetical protein H8E83_00715 [Planctomycetes bacterium]|nr:hypothetical protein [Planctomycetota bacterium]